MVDDEAGYRDLLSYELSGEGFSVLTASCGAEAMAALDGGGVSLVITDMRMPGLDGLDVVRAVTERRPDIPVVLMTGYAVEARAEEACGRACALLRKPFDMDELKAAVKAHSR